MSRKSPRLSPPGYLVTIARLSWPLIITVDNAITHEVQRDKNARELKLANAAITGHADASA